MAKKYLTALDMGSQKITSLANGTAANDAVNKAQLDAVSGGGTQNLFIDPDPPGAPPSKYMWIETGLGADGQGFTFWFEDAVA